MRMRLDGRFKRQVKAAFGRYHFEVGVLEQRMHKDPRRPSEIRSVAGGPARKASRKSSGLTIAQVSERARKSTGINYLTLPFRGTGKNRDIVRFANAALKLMLGREENTRRVNNLLQAIVRNPITRGDYGGNKPTTRKIKGFSRLFIDTGQLFQNIKARVVRRGVA